MFSRKQNELGGDYFMKWHCRRSAFGMRWGLWWGCVHRYFTLQMDETTGGQKENHLRICMLHIWEEMLDDFSLCWLLNTCASREEIFQTLIRRSLQYKRGEDGFEVTARGVTTAYIRQKSCWARSERRDGCPFRYHCICREQWRVYNSPPNHVSGPNRHSTSSEEGPISECRSFYFTVLCE